MKFWEATTFGNGIISLVYRDAKDPVDTGIVKIGVKTGFLEGEMRLSEDEVRKLKWFVRQIK